MANEIGKYSLVLHLDNGGFSANQTFALTREQAESIRRYRLRRAEQEIRRLVDYDSQNGGIARSSEQGILSQVNDARILEIILTQSTRDFFD